MNENNTAATREQKVDARYSDRSRGRFSAPVVTRENRKKTGKLRKTGDVSPELQKEIAEAKMVPAWINDEKGGIEAALESGYVFVNRTTNEENSTSIGDTRISNRAGTSKDNQSVTRYLMAIPEEYYNADQAERDQKAADIDERILKGQATDGSGQECQVNTPHGSTYVHRDTRYTPSR